MIDNQDGYKHLIDDDGKERIVICGFKRFWPDINKSEILICKTCHKFVTNDTKYWDSVSNPNFPCPHCKASFIIYK